MRFAEITQIGGDERAPSRLQRHRVVERVEEVLIQLYCQSGGALVDGEAICHIEVEREEVGKLVHDAIDRLPENFRIVVTLRDIEGMSTEETAV